MTIKLGLRLPQRDRVDLQRDIVEVARTAEAAGFASLWTYERLLFPVEPKEPYSPDKPGWPVHQRTAVDPLAVLTVGATVTTRVRLGSAVLIAALHTPVQLAKSLATIDQISGGRVVAGLGLGWATDEFQAAGAIRAHRGRRMDETLDILDAVWGPDPVNYRGPNAVIDDAYVLPKPVSKIPVMLSGSSPRALERVARRADGWLPLYETTGPQGVEGIRATWENIRDMAAQHGRDAGRLELIPVGNITFTDRPQGADRPAFVGTLDQVIEDIASVAASGASEVILDLNLQDWFTDSSQMVEMATEIHQRVTAAGI